MYDILELNKKLLPELREIAKELDIKRVESYKKQDLVYKILDQQAIAASEAKTSRKDASDQKRKGRNESAQDAKSASGRPRRGRPRKSEESPKPQPEAAQPVKAEAPAELVQKKKEGQPSQQRPSRDFHDENRANGTPRPHRDEQGARHPRQQKETSQRHDDDRKRPPYEKNQQPYRKNQQNQQNQAGNQTESAKSAAGSPTE